MNKAVAIRYMRYWIALGITGFGLLIMGLTSPSVDVANVIVGGLYLVIAVLLLVWGPPKKLIPKARRTQLAKNPLVARIFELTAERCTSERLVLHDAIQHKVLVVTSAKTHLFLVLSGSETDFQSPNGAEEVVAGTVYAMMRSYTKVIRQGFVNIQGQETFKPSLPDDKLLKSMPGFFTATDDELRALIKALEEWDAAPGG